MESCLFYADLQKFSVCLRTGSNPVNNNRFRSHTGKNLVSVPLLLCFYLSPDCYDVTVSTWTWQSGWLTVKLCRVSSVNTRVRSSWLAEDHEIMSCRSTENWTCSVKKIKCPFFKCGRDITQSIDLGSFLQSL